MKRYACLLLLCLASLTWTVRARAQIDPCGCPVIDCGNGSQQTSCFGQSQGCFCFDPCGRQAGADFTPSCGSFTATSDANPQGAVTVSCGSCPRGGQCGGTTFGGSGRGPNDIYCSASQASCPSANWCFQPCASGADQCSGVAGVGPNPDNGNWGVSLLCGNGPCVSESASAIVVGGSVTFSGLYSAPNTPISMSIRHNGGGWTTGQVTQSNSKGAFSFGWSPSSAGNWQITFSSTGYTSNTLNLQASNVSHTPVPAMPKRFSLLLGLALVAGALAIARHRRSP